MPFDATPVEQSINLGELAIVDGVIDMLESPYRWCKGAFKQGQSYCLVGAVSLVATGNPYSVARGHRAPEAAYKVLRKLDVAAGLPTTLFNDAASTTHADILALLTRVRAQFQ